MEGKRKYKSYMDKETNGQSKVPRTTSWRNKTYRAVKPQDAVNSTCPGTSESTGVMNSLRCATLETRGVWRDISSLSEGELSTSTDQSTSGDHKITCSDASESDMEATELNGLRKDEDFQCSCDGSDDSSDALDEQLTNDTSASNDNSCGSRERNEYPGDIWDWNEGYDFSFLSSSPSKSINLSRVEVLCMIISLIVRHKLTDTALLDIVHLINILQGSQVLPESLHLIRKLLGFQDRKLALHYFCTYCKMYCGQMTDIMTTGVLKCPICSRPISRKEGGNYFLIMPVKEQIANILESASKNGVLNSKQRFSPHFNSPNSISDIYDGEPYRLMSADQKMLGNLDNFSYTFHVDGAQVSRSSSGTIWPINLIINELHPKDRGKHIVMAALWYGKSEPHMQMLMKAFVDEMNDLQQAGVLWRDPSGRTVQSRLFPTCLSADAPARADVLNSVRFNGYFGCTWCLNPGFLVKNTVKYPVKPGHVTHQLRTNDMVISDMKQLS